MSLIYSQSRVAQGGMMLIEALVGILIFSIGVLALIALQAASISATADAKYRVEALNLANQMLGDMWVGVDHSGDAVLQATLLAYEHNTGTPGTDCAFDGGADSAKPQVIAWDALVKSTLPNAQAQINVIIGANNQVAITICWKPPSDQAAADPHRYILLGNIK